MDQTEAARAVSIEVVNILGAFKDDLVIVGGWVPDLKYPAKKQIGSLDVDLAVGPGAVGQDAYTTILARLKNANYSHATGPTRFYRAVPGVEDPVKVDLITGRRRLPRLRFGFRSQPASSNSTNNATRKNAWPEKPPKRTKNQIRRPPAANAPAV